MSGLGNRFRSWSVALGSFLVFVASVRLFGTEYGTIRFSTGTTNDIVAALADQRIPLPEPASARSSRGVLASCARVLTVSPALKLDSALAARVTSRCAQVAQNELETSPANGRALALDLLTANSLAPEKLSLAQKAAPFEPWALNVRLQAIARADVMASDIGDLAKADFGRAVLSDWGRTTLADLYLGKPDLR